MVLSNKGDGELKRNKCQKNGATGCLRKSVEAPGMLHLMT